MLWAIVFGLVVAAAVIGYSRTYLGIDAGSDALQPPLAPLLAAYISQCRSLAPPHGQNSLSSSSSSPWWLLSA